MAKGTAKLRSDLGVFGIVSPLALVLTLVVIVALAASVRVGEDAQVGEWDSRGPELVIARMDRMSRSDASRARLELLDPTPLFMPMADLESGFVPVAPSSRPGGSVGVLFAPEIFFRSSDVGRRILAPFAPKTAIEGLDVVEQGRTFFGLAHYGDTSSYLGASLRVARVEIYREGEGAPLLNIDMAPVAAIFPVGWRPAEFSVIVGRSGATARPSLVTGSGSDETDERLRDILTNDVILRVRLRPGMYRVWVGP